MLNQMAAAGHVTLPSTITDQILAGLDHLTAAAYQTLIFLTSAGASAMAAGVKALSLAG